MTEIDNTIENSQDSKVANVAESEASIGTILSGGSDNSNDGDAPNNIPIIEQEEDKDSEEESTKEEKIELDYKQEYEKLQKNLKETQSWGHSKARESKDISRKLEATEAQLKEYIESGALTPDEGDLALKHTAHNRPENIETPLTKGEEIEHILNETFPQVVKFNTDPDIHKYGEAFYHMTQSISTEDLQKLTDDLDRVKKDPVLMTKNAIELGKQYYNDFYGELQEAGGVHGLTSNYRNKVAEQQKTIDKLKKDIVRLRQDSDYTGTAGYSIPSSSPKEANTVRNRSLDGIFGRAKSGKI